MIKIFIISFAIFSLAALGMALGLLLGGHKRCLKGSCSRLTQLDDNQDHCLCLSDRPDANSRRR